MALLELDGVGFTYPRAHRPALTDVTIAEDAGSLTVLLGPNGSGKSTLFRLLLGITRPTTGRLAIDGEPVQSLSARDLARRIAYIPQQEQTAFDYTGRQCVLMGRTPHLPTVRQRLSAADLAATDAAIARLGIERLADRGLRTMSGGERQLVLLARALCQEARLLVLDEPTSALDLANQALVLQTLRDLADDGLLVLLSSHDPSHALTWADRAILLRSGRVMRAGPAADVGEADLRELYGAPLRVVASSQLPGVRLVAVAPRDGGPGSGAVGSSAPNGVSPWIDGGGKSGPGPMGPMGQGRGSGEESRMTVERGEHDDS